MTTPDTTDAVVQALGAFTDHEGNIARGVSIEALAKAAIQAHNKAMRELVPEQFVHIANRDTVAAEHFVRGFNEARTLILGEENDATT